MNGYLQKKREADHNVSLGIQYGTDLMQRLTLFVLHNVLPDYVEEPKMPEVLNAIEKESQRVWAEAIRECKDPRYMAEWVNVRMRELRKKYEMEEYDD